MRRRRIFPALALLLALLLTVSCAGGRELAETVTPETTASDTTAEPLPDTTEETDPPLPEAMSVVDVSKQAYGYEELCEDLTVLAEAYPSRLSVEPIGTTLDNRTIYCAVLGDKAADKQIVIHAGVHGREYMTSLLTMRQLEYYVTYYEAAEYGGIPLSELLSEYCFYVVPMANPDGAMLSQRGLNGIKSEELLAGIRAIYEKDAHYGYATTSSGEIMDIWTYLRFWKANARGVDLNRNYDAMWEEFDGVPRPCYRNHKGEAPASEPETQAMITLVESLENPVSVVSIHAQGSILYWNCGQDDPEPSRELAEAIGDLTGYRVIEEQHNDASFNDWVILEKGLPSVTVEIGKISCPLPISEFPRIYEECRDLWAMLAALYRS